MLREKIYELKNWKLAVHTTWNPGAENVMRIHLVPPRFLPGKIVPSVVILNGQEIVPVSEAWAILLTEFIKRINQYENHAIEEKELQQVLKETFGAVRKIYPKTDPEVFRRDLSVMLDTFEDVTRWKKIWNHPDCKARRMETAQMKQECPLRGKAERTR